MQPQLSRASAIVVAVIGCMFLAPMVAAANAFITLYAAKFIVFACGIEYSSVYRSDPVPGEASAWMALGLGFIVECVLILTFSVYMAFSSRHITARQLQWIMFLGHSVTILLVTLGALSLEFVVGVR